MKKEYLKNIFKNIAIALALAIFFLADRVLKSLALKLDSIIDIIPNIFAFSLTKNYFISFSLPFLVQF